MKTYRISMIDTEKTPAWLDLCESQSGGDQDSFVREGEVVGRYVFTATTEQPAALEAALDADDGVLEYEEAGEDDAAVLRIHVAASVGTPSQHYPDDEQRANGALDYDVTLTIGDREVTGGVTLYPDPANGGMGSCGSPRDGWCSGALLAAIDDLDETAQRLILAEIEATAARGGASEIEVPA